MRMSPRRPLSPPTPGGWSAPIGSWAALVLAGCLLLAQAFWVAHEVHHLSEDGDADCVICLIGGHAPATLPLVLAWLLVIGRTRVLVSSRPLVIPYRATHRPQSPRAPPGALPHR